MTRKLDLIPVLFVGLIAACAQGTPQEGQSVDAVRQSAKDKEPICTTMGPEEQSLVQWANTASFDTLNDPPQWVDGVLIPNCNLPVDTANQIVKGRPYACARELADRQEVGNGALSALIQCGKKHGVVSQNLAAVFDQPAERADLVVVFTADEAASTVGFVDLATRDELMRVPGIGPAIADDIIAMRPIRYVNRLFYQVSGIGVTRLTALKDASDGWDPDVPYVTPPTAGSYVLSDLDARTMITDAVDLLMAGSSNYLWYNGCYWAYGGEYFTDAFSQNYCLTHIEGYIWEDTYEVVMSWIGDSFTDRATVEQAIDDVVDFLFDSEFDRYIEYYAESIGEATC